MLVENKENLSPVKTKEKVIQQTVALIIEKGYHGTGVNEILRATKIPKGSFYHHFPKGKDELVTEALRSSTIKLSMQYKKLLKESESLQEGLEKLLDHSKAELQSSKYKARSILVNVSQEVGSINKSLQATCKQLFELIINALESFFHEHNIDTWQESARSFYTRLQGAIVLSKAYQTTSFLDDHRSEVSLNKGL